MTKTVPTAPQADGGGQDRLRGRSQIGIPSGELLVRTEHRLHGSPGIYSVTASHDTGQKASEREPCDYAVVLH
jgi:hypothetical protein